MPPSRRINVVWFKCTDLRVHDHAALKAAHAEGLPVLHLYVFDPFWHSNRTRLAGFPKTGALRTRFQLEALADLQARLAEAGHVLCTRSGISTKRCFEELCADFTVNAVFAFDEICSEELAIERHVRGVLRRSSQGSLRLFWGFELYHHDDLSFDPKRARGAFNSYTAFRKRVEENSWVRPSAQETPRFHTGQDCAVRWGRADADLPGVRELMGAVYDPTLDPGDKVDPRAEFRWQGGETAALARVRDYLWEEDSLGLEYVGATMTTDPAKSCMRDKAMSKLAPWLAHGCLSPRFLYEEVKRYERERGRTKGTYWITHELVWRDFVRFGSIFAGTSIFRIEGPAGVRPAWPWSTDMGLLTAWRDGRTGFPFVDCFMRELKTTGYCNHMGRECSGWFLIGDLGLDWRMGAEWFESVLLDYEPTANWYNWTYRCLPAAGRGEPTQGLLVDTPGHRLHGLEILKWGAQHDPDAKYIKRWVPELSPLPPTIAREPWRLGLDRPGDNGTAVHGLVAMGFSEAQAAEALRRTGGDAEAAVALLVGGHDEDGGGGAGDESDDIARAIAMSLEDAAHRPPSAGRQPAAPAAATTALGGPEASPGRFRYGTDYPLPVIAPVSIRGIEDEEDFARRAQAERDRQIALSKRRRGSSGGGVGSGPAGGTFSKDRWEEARRRRPAETPTSAGKGGGKGGQKGKSPSGGGGESWRAAGAVPERKRRWGAKEVAAPGAVDDRAQGA